MNVALADDVSLRLQKLSRPRANEKESAWHLVCKPVIYEGKDESSSEHVRFQVLWLLMAPPQNLSHHERDSFIHSITVSPLSPHDSNSKASKDRQMVSTLFAGKLWCVQDAIGNTPLHQAAAGGNLELAA